jgi:drug/metabolite transporter, DME family
VKRFGILVGLTTAVFFVAYIVLSDRVSATGETIGGMLKVFAVASLFWIAYQLTQGMPWMLLALENFLNIYVRIAGNLLAFKFSKTVFSQIVCFESHWIY